MTNVEKHALLDAVWSNLPLEDKERILEEDGWSGVIDNLKTNGENK